MVERFMTNLDNLDPQFYMVCRQISPYQDRNFQLVTPNYQLSVASDTKKVRMIYRPGFWNTKMVNGLGFLGSLQQLKRMSREPSLGHLTITKITRRENALGIEIDVRRPQGDPSLTNLAKMRDDINFWTLNMFISVHNHLTLMDSHSFYCLEAHNPYHWYYLPQRDTSFFCTMHWLSDGLQRSKEMKLYYLNSATHASI